MYAQLEMDEEQALETADLQIYIQWLQEWESMGMSIYTLPEKEVMSLVDYA
jgi:hypothetical protein